LNPERLGSTLVQEKYLGEKACDKRHPYRIIIIVVITKIVSNERLLLSTVISPKSPSLLYYRREFFKSSQEKNHSFKNSHDLCRNLTKSLSSYDVCNTAIA